MIYTQKITIDTNLSFELPLYKTQENEYCSIWQSLSWQKMILASKSAQEVFLVYEKIDEKIICYSFLEKRALGAGFFGMFCIGGPAVFVNKISSEFLQKLEEVSQNEKCLFLQIEPLEDIEGLTQKEGSYKKFIQEYTVFVNLKQTLEEIRADMKQKGRYNIKVAQKKEIACDFFPYTKENQEKFFSLLAQTSQRNGFSISSSAYFDEILRYAQQNNCGGIYAAHKDGEWLCAGIFLFAGDTVLYYYGASTGDEEKKRWMAPYQLHWHIIQLAKEKGYTLYDFLGVAPAGATKNHPLSGVSDFKYKFSSWIFQFPSAKIKIFRKEVYYALQVYHFCKKLFKK